MAKAAGKTRADHQATGGEGRMARIARFRGTASVIALFMGVTPAFAQSTDAPPADQATAQEAQTVEDAPPVADQSGDEIVVTGLRRSLETSQAIKRNSEGIVDAIVAEDIGKLPDITASAALARVTGVQVNRAAGEAAQVQVRGLPDITTTYNGREIFTAEGRFVQIQDFPAGSVAALEVYKSSTANLIEGGIGGQVNVRSRRPFDFSGFEAFGSLNAVHTDQAQEFDWNGNFLISNRWDTGIGEIGILVNAAYTKLRHLDSTREQSLVAGIGRLNDDEGEDFDYLEDTFRYPDATAMFYGAGERWRPSATATIQWKPTPNLEIYADGLFQGFRSKDTNTFLFVPLFGNVQLSNVQLMDDGVRAQSLTASYPNAIDFRPDGFQGTTRAKTDTYQGALGAIYTNDALTISGDVAYTDSTFTLRAINVDHAFAYSPVRDVNFDAPGAFFSFRDFDGSDLDNFLYRGLFQENLRAEGDDLQARVDVTYDLDAGFLKRIQAGVRYDDRSAARRRGDLYIGEEFPFPRMLGNLQIDGQRIPLEFAPVAPGFRGDDVQRFRTFIQPVRDSIWDNVEILREVAGAPEGFPDFDPVQTFLADEKSYTGYAQVKYGFDAGAVAFDGNVGIRAIRTETTIAGTQREQIGIDENNDPIYEFTGVDRSNEYDDFLPNASLRAVLGEVQLRLAYTQTRTRPNFFDLNPSFAIGTPPTICIPNPQIPGSGPDNPNCFRGTSAGNPDLGPLTSTNYDASLEWYFSRAGSVTLAAFRRDVNGFISRITTETQDPEFGRLRTSIPVNGGEGRIQGIEAAFASFLDVDWVPEWARGFGLQANFTYIDAESQLPSQLAGNVPPGSPDRPRLPGVSEYAYNIVALYEKPKFSARLAYNYRSDFVIEYGRVFDPGTGDINPETGLPFGGDGPVLPLMHKGRGVLDLSLTTTPVENITIAFDATNLLGDPIEIYREYEPGKPFPRQTKFLERVYSLGVRFRF
ncbi:TonB-dependent receptor [Sphingomonas gilva]|nr:TonB-dependent receptor [Sphingomonas gilva]